MDTFDPNDLDPFVRNTDAYTSVIAAVRASHASTKAVAAVARLMNDERDRIDYEIWQECRANGYISSFATVRHGRLVFSDTKLLVETGETRPTPDGLPSRVWCRAPGVVLPEEKLRIRVPNRMSPPKRKVKRPSKFVIDAAIEDLRLLAEAGINLSENVKAVVGWLSALQGDVA
jgi:hypothetical protein